MKGRAIISASNPLSLLHLWLPDLIAVQKTIWEREKERERDREKDRDRDREGYLLKTQVDYSTPRSTRGRWDKEQGTEHLTYICLLNPNNN